jgi:sarcosine oxidase, subunit beta
VAAGSDEEDLRGSGGKGGRGRREVRNGYFIGSAVPLGAHLHRRHAALSTLVPDASLEVLELPGGDGARFVERRPAERVPDPVVDWASNRISVGRFHRRCGRRPCTFTPRSEFSAVPSPQRGSKRGAAWLAVELMPFEQFVASTLFSFVICVTMHKAAADVVVAGAGICGLSAARYLARLLPPSATITLVSQHAAASYTSSLSTECYRDHWPTEVMRAFMGRSIGLIHAHAAETNDAFRVQNRGYLYVSSAPNAPQAFLEEGRQCHAHSPGALRTRSSSSSSSSSSPAAYASLATGADVLADGATLRSLFPYLHPDLTAALHARNAGWVSAQTMGACMLDELEALRTPDGRQRVRLVRGTVSAADTGPDFSRVRSVTVTPLAEAAGGGGRDSTRIECGVLVNATGPFLDATHLRLFGEDPAAPSSSSSSSLPIFSEVHSKVVFRDTLRVIPRDAPMVISNDAVTPLFAPEELEFIAETRGKEVADKLAGPLSAGAHFRPYGGAGSDAVLMLWECWHHGVRPTTPPQESADGLLDHELYPEVALRGLATVVPDLAVYFDEDKKSAWLERAKGKAGAGEVGAGGEAAKPLVDGGYYTKTLENIPLIGPAPGRGGEGVVENAYLCGAVSGYGIMAGHAAGELLAQHVVAGTSSGSSGGGGAKKGKGEGAFPAYADLMDPRRYQRDDFMRKGGVRDQLLAAGGGQL